VQASLGDEETHDLVDVEGIAVGRFVDRADELRPRGDTGALTIRSEKPF